MRFTLNMLKFLTLVFILENVEMGMILSQFLNKVNTKFYLMWRFMQCWMDIIGRLFPHSHPVWRDFTNL